jgi:hypothetical protein
MDQSENHVKDEASYSRDNFSSNTRNELTPLKPFATFVYITFGAMALMSIVSLILTGIVILIVGQAQSMNVGEESLDLLLKIQKAEEAIKIFNWIFGVLGIIAFCLWIYRANRNLYKHQLHGMEFTPGWSVGWFFIPIATFWMPFRAMREIWKGSTTIDNDDEKEHWKTNEPSSILGVWWALYVGGRIFAYIGIFFLLGAEKGITQEEFLTGTAFVIFSITAILTANFLIMKIVHEITKMQSSGSEAIE